MVTVGLHDAERNVQPLRVFDRLVAGDDGAVPIDEHGPAGAIVARRAFERRTPAIGAAVRVGRIGGEIGKLPHVSIGYLPS